MEELHRQGLLEYRAKQLMQVTREDLQWAEVVLVGRADSWYEYRLVRRLRSAGKVIAYILDDDLLNISHVSKSASYFQRPEIRKSINRILGLSDALISPSPVLLKKYAPSTRKQLGLLTEEPSVHVGIYEQHDPMQPVRIGFAGSVDRTQDIETILKDALVRIKSEYGSRVEVQFYGAVPSYAEALDAKVIPYCDSYEEYKRTLNGLGWDIGLAPMPDTEFHACKHYNKYVEYAGAGILGVYSDVAPYTRLKARSGVGLFVENSSNGWYAAIRSLIEDRERLETMRKQVHEDAQSALSIQSVAAEYWHQLAQIVPESVPEDRTMYHIFLYKIEHFVWKAVSFLNHYRFRSVHMLLEKLKKSQ